MRDVRQASAGGILLKGVLIGIGLGLGGPIGGAIASVLPIND